MAEPMRRMEKVPGLPAGERALPAAAESVGEKVGRAVAQAREQAGDIKERFRVIRGKARHAAAEKAGELRAAARQRIGDARARAQRLTRERPLQLILGAAAAGFLIGVALRVWRSNRD